MKSKHIAAAILIAIQTAILSVAVLWLFPGCAWLEQPATKAKLSATGSWLLGKATNIALSAVVSAATSQADAGNKADWLDSFATGLRTKATASFGGDDVRTLAGIWTPDKPHWQELAGQLGDLAKQAASVPPAQRNEIIAQAVQIAAQLARAKPEGAFLTRPDPVPPLADEEREDIINPPGAPFPIVLTRQ
jgi:hypothetical protein